MVRTNYSIFCSKSWQIFYFSFIISFPYTMCSPSISPIGSSSLVVTRCFRFWQQWPSGQCYVNIVMVSYAAVCNALYLCTVYRLHCSFKSVQCTLKTLHHILNVKCRVYSLPCLVLLSGNTHAVEHVLTGRCFQPEVCSEKKRGTWYVHNSSAILQHCRGGIIGQWLN